MKDTYYLLSEHPHMCVCYTEKEISRLLFDLHTEHVTLAFISQSQSNSISCQRPKKILLTF